MIRTKLIAVSLFFIGLYCLLPQPAYATPKGITLAPAIQNITVTPGSIQTFTVSLTNQTASTQVFKLYALDFGSLNETGGIAFAGTEGSNLIKKYGMAKWISLPTEPISIAVGVTASITATITDNPSLQPGGHYAAIMAAAQTAGTSSGPGVGLDQTLSSLVLAQKNGGEHHDLRLNKTEHNGNWLHLPTKAKLRFYNPGNIHVVPRGTVQVTTPSGKVIAEGIINDESGILLPETYRQLYVPMHQIGSNGSWPGLYKLRVQYRYDGLDRFATRTQTIFFLNIPGVCLMVLLIGGTAISVFLAQKYYFRHRRSKPKQPPKDTSDKPRTRPKLVLR